MLRPVRALSLAACSCMAMAMASTPAVAGPPAPQADRVDKVVVLPLRFSGAAGEKWRDRLTDALVDGLALGDLELVAPADVATMLQREDTTCRDPECRKELADRSGATYFVQTTISVQDRVYEVTINIINGPESAVAATLAEDCQLCGVEEVADVVTKQAAVIQQKLETLTTRPAVVSITSTPAGAKVLIDGELVGTTPMETEVVAGDHKVALTLEGYETQTRRLDVVAGVHETVGAKLFAKPKPGPTETVPAAPKRDWRKWGRPLGWSLLGVGAATLATGVAFVVVDERDYEPRCDGSDIDPNGNCRFRYDTTAFGAAMTGIGTAALIGGAVLVGVTWNKGKGQGDRSRARVTFGPRGVGVHGRF